MKLSSASRSAEAGENSGPFVVNSAAMLVAVLELALELEPEKKEKLLLRLQLVPVWLEVGDEP